jgi:hypothetical protein
MSMRQIERLRDIVEQEIAHWLRTCAPVPVCRELAERVARGDYREAKHSVIKLRYLVRGAHVHVRVFMGPRAEEVALCGNLVMNEDEWRVFADVAMHGALQTPDTASLFLEDDP